MSAWNTLLLQIQEHLDELAQIGCDCPYFRGHSDAEWKLLSGLGRKGPDRSLNVESILYYEFMSQAGPLLDRPGSRWDVLFSMQHHGLPTRLLDWSATFAVALYFALKPHLAQSAPEGSEPCIWVLDPFELNRAMGTSAVVLNPETDLMGTYQEIFIEECKTLGAKVMAVNPTQTGRRLAAQRGCFTLHADLFSPLERGLPKYLRKFTISRQCVEEASQFLRLAGMNEFALFPDLDGLARHLKHNHVDWC